MKHLIITLLTVTVALAIQTPRATSQMTKTKLEAKRMDQKSKREAALENASELFYPSPKYFSEIKQRAIHNKASSPYYHQQHFSDFNGFRSGPEDIGMPKVETYIIKTETGSDGSPNVVYKVFAMSPSFVASTFGHDDKIIDEMSNHGDSHESKENSSEEVENYAHFSSKGKSVTNNAGHIQTVVIPYQHTNVGSKMLYRYGNQNSASMASHNSNNNNNNNNNNIQYQHENAATTQVHKDAPNDSNYNHGYNGFKEVYSQGPKQNYNNEASKFNKNISPSHVYNKSTVNYADVVPHNTHTNGQYFNHNSNSFVDNNNHNNDGGTLTMISQTKKPSYGYGGEHGDLSASLDALASTFGKPGINVYPSKNHAIPTVTVTHVAPATPAVTDTPMVQHDAQTPGYAHGHKGLSHFGMPNIQHLHTDIIHSDKHDAMKSNFKPSHFLGAINEPTQHTENHASEFYQPPPPTSGNYDYPDPSLIMKQNLHYSAPVYESESMYSVPQASNLRYKTVVATTTTPTKRTLNYHHHKN